MYLKDIKQPMERWTDIPYGHGTGPKVSTIFSPSISTCLKQVMNHFLDLSLPSCGEGSKALRCFSTDSWLF